MNDSIETAADIARAGNRFLNFISGALTVCLVLVGGYMIWYTYMVYQSAFLNDDLLKYKPTLDGDSNPSLYDLMAINPDVVGWITIDGTNIDYPIVQGRDNQEYLTLNVFREYTLSGSVFLDSGNNPEFTDPYNIIYGHHMDNGAMFGQVLDFLNKDFFDKYPTGILFLPEKTYAISFFESMEANAYDSRILSVGKQQSDMTSFLTYTRNNSVQYRDLNPALSGSDIIISLVTCENANTDGRAVLMGRLDEIEFIQQGEPDTSGD